MNKQGLIGYLKKRNFYVLSPHFDDAALSMGMFLRDAGRAGARATVVNCFTRAHGGPYTLSARQFLKTSGYTDALKLVEAREKEDGRALSFLNVKTIDLGLTDGLFRTYGKRNLLGKLIPEAGHLYPTYGWHLTRKINPSDTAPRELSEKLKTIIKSDAVVFAPYGVGNHADHVIVSQVAAKLFKNIIYYIDFPYNVRLNYADSAPEGYAVYNHAVDLKLKSEIIANYKSQVNGLFEKGVMPTHSENFLLPKSIYA